jgi:hypothetical protein
LNHAAQEYETVSTAPKAGHRNTEGRSSTIFESIALAKKEQKRQDVAQSHQQRPLLRRHHAISFGQIKKGESSSHYYYPYMLLSRMLQKQQRYTKDSLKSRGEMGMMMKFAGNCCEGYAISNEARTGML